MSKFKAYANGQGGYQSANPSHGFQITYTKDGSTQLSPRDVGAMDYQVSLRLKGLGYAELEAVGNNPDIRATDLGAGAGSKVTYEWNDNLSEWWINDTKGLEQWFYLRAAPGKLGVGTPLRLRMGLETDLAVQQKGNKLILEKEGTRLSYDKLRVWDARGQELEAHLSWDGANLDLEIVDATAQYPY